jgi:DNA polymerase-3 subunit gamma/tau
MDIVHCMGYNISMLAMYRKYRPKRFEDVLGQESIVRIIKNAAKTDRLSHAYLFYGARGSGKTTTARLIAKIANCQKRQSDPIFKQTGEPCNACPACIEIDSGNAMDIIEIDAASTRGIDDIRSLKEGALLSPSSYTYKVFIIDEVHQLSKDAFNALLKILEEPPQHAIFILATTEYEKVPPTIASRAQRFHFKKIPLKELVDKLKKIVSEEKITFEEEALELIAAGADGSFRDAESLLDQIAAMEEKITVESVERILGRVAFSRVSDLVDLIIAKDLESALANINAVHEDGYNIVQFAKDLIHYYRRVLAIRFSPKLEHDFRQLYTAREVDTLLRHSKSIEEKATIALVKALIAAYTEMRYSPFAIVPLELALIENLKAS